MELVHINTTASHPLWTGAWAAPYPSWSKYFRRDNNSPLPFGKATATRCWKFQIDWLYIIQHSLTFMSWTAKDLDITRCLQTKSCWKLGRLCGVTSVVTVALPKDPPHSADMLKQGAWEPSIITRDIHGRNCHHTQFCIKTAPGPRPGS